MRCAWPILCLLAACGGDAPAPEAVCTEDDCAATCDPPLAMHDLSPGPVDLRGLPENELSDFEWSLVGERVMDLRAGVRPWAEDRIGVCRGETGCREFLGLEAGTLQPGPHRLHAELRVPAVPDLEWRVQFKHHCLVEKPLAGDATAKTHHTDAEMFTLSWPGADRPVVLSPVPDIPSPSPDGTVYCGYSYNLYNPTGVTEIEGHYVVPFDGEDPDEAEARRLAEARAKLAAEELAKASAIALRQVFPGADLDALGTPSPTTRVPGDAPPPAPLPDEALPDAGGPAGPDGPDAPPEAPPADEAAPEGASDASDDG